MTLRAGSSNSSVSTTALRTAHAVAEASAAHQGADNTQLDNMQRLKPRSSLTQSYQLMQPPTPRVRQKFMPPANLLNVLPGSVLRQIADAREADAAHTLSGVDVAHLASVSPYLRREVLPSDRVDAARLTAAAAALAAPPTPAPFDPTVIPKIRPELEAILGGPHDAPDAKTIKNLPPELQSAPLVALTHNWIQWPDSDQKITEDWSINVAEEALGTAHQSRELKRAQMMRYPRQTREAIFALNPAAIEHYMNEQMDEFVNSITDAELVAWRHADRAAKEITLNECPLMTPHDLAASFSKHLEMAQDYFNLARFQNPNFPLQSLADNPEVAATLREARTNPDALAQLPLELLAVRPFIQAAQALIP
jgi:hypothetical protein